MARLPALAVLVSIFVLAPLPFALYMGGVDWILDDSSTGMKECVVTYVIAFLAFAGPISVIVFKNRADREQQSSELS